MNAQMSIRGFQIAFHNGSPVVGAGGAVSANLAPLSVDRFQACQLAGFTIIVPAELGLHDISARFERPATGMAGGSELGAT
jgi:hypothetical protein